VIQGQSTEPVRPLSGFLFSAGALTDDVAASGAVLVWFVTWARRAGHPDYELLGLIDPETMTRSLDSAYASAFLYGDRLGVVRSAHVGIAFQIAIAEHPEIDLYDADGSHPSPAGSFLASCVLAQTITGEAPRVPDPPPAALDRTTAEELCAIAPRVACLAGQTFCDGACVSLANDPLHCGGCGVVCAGDLPCIEASCQCADPETSACPGRVCRNLYVDVWNCGACGMACDIGQRCESGACACQEPTSPQRVQLTDLTALRAGCVRGAETWQPECFAAVSEWCAGSSCFTTGIGPITPVVFAPEAAVTCLAGDLRTTSYSELAALVPGCTGPDAVTSEACVGAIHRACVAAGAAAGFGPVGGDAASIEIACVPSAALVTVDLAELAALWPSCDGAAIRGGRECAFASHRLCTDAGHGSGFGPVETAGDTATIVCLDP
jgi:hypothetical protein